MCLEREQDRMQEENLQYKEIQRKIKRRGQEKNTTEEIINFISCAKTHHQCSKMCVFKNIFIIGFLSVLLFDRCFPIITSNSLEFIFLFENSASIFTDFTKFTWMI